MGGPSVAQFQSEEELFYRRFRPDEGPGSQARSPNLSTVVMISSPSPEVWCHPVMRPSIYVHKSTSNQRLPPRPEPQPLCLWFHSAREFRYPNPEIPLMAVPQSRLWLSPLSIGTEQGAGQYLVGGKDEGLHTQRHLTRTSHSKPQNIIPVNLRPGNRTLYMQTNSTNYAACGASTVSPKQASALSTSRA